MRAADLPLFQKTGHVGVIVVANILLLLPGGGVASPGVSAGPSAAKALGGSSRSSIRSQAQSRKTTAARAQPEAAIFAAQRRAAAWTRLARAWPHSQAASFLGPAPLPVPERDTPSALPPWAQGHPLGPASQASVTYQAPPRPISSGPPSGSPASSAILARAPQPPPVGQHRLSA